MEITIKTHQLTPAEELKNFVQNNIGRLLHLYDSIETAEELLKMEKPDSTGDKATT
ncbi:MAG: hypothetical protein H7320_18515 [Ferruginibacter sp.]|nr:hypothetical protein [Ferruginibacter sp.]